MNDNKVEIKEKFINNFISLKPHTPFIHDEVISLKDGIFISCSWGAEILIIDIHKDIILFEVDFSEYHKDIELDFSNLFLSNDKKFIYISFYTRIYAISTKNYEINLLYNAYENESYPAYGMRKMNNPNFLALFSDVDPESYSINLDIFDITSKSIAETICIEEGFDFNSPILFTKDDRYLVLNVFYEFLVYDLKEKKICYKEKLNQGFILDRISEEYKFSKNDKYLIAPFNVERQVIHEEGLVSYDNVLFEPLRKFGATYGIANIIDFETKKTIYHLSEKVADCFFGTGNPREITISNDGNYAFIYMSFGYIPFEISTGKILDIPYKYISPNHTFFFDPNYPNHLGILGDEYILAEIRYKDLY